MPQEKGSIPLLILLFALAWPVRDGPPQAPLNEIPQPIALYEAEILVYLLPDAQEVRKQGFEVGWELETSSPDLNQEDFYVFWVVNATRPNVEGSRTVGFYAVNKHNADVWDYTEKVLVAGNELEGVQRILRRAHRIDQPTIKKYRSRDVYRMSPAK